MKHIGTLRKGNFGAALLKGSIEIVRVQQLPTKEKEWSVVYKEDNSDFEKRVVVNQENPGLEPGQICHAYQLDSELFYFSDADGNRFYMKGFDPRKKVIFYKTMENGRLDALLPVSVFLVVLILIKILEHSSAANLAGPVLFFATCSLISALVYFMIRAPRKINIMFENFIHEAQKRDEIYEYNIPRIGIVEKILIKLGLGDRFKL